MGRRPGRVRRPALRGRSRRQDLTRRRPRPHPSAKKAPHRMDRSNLCDDLARGPLCLTPHIPQGPPNGYSPLRKRPPWKCSKRPPRWPSQSVEEVKANPALAIGLAGGAARISRRLAGLWDLSRLHRAWRRRDHWRRLGFAVACRWPRQARPGDPRRRCLVRSRSSAN